MIELIYHKKHFFLPENYNELTGSQLIEINKILAFDVPWKHLIRLKVLRVLLDMSLFKFFMLPVDCKLRILYPGVDVSEITDEEDLQSSIDWVFEKNSLTEQLIPEYRGYHGPKKEFDNLRVSEFHVCEMAYHDFIISGLSADLNKLVACLYRPAKTGYDFAKDPDGDCRIPFNPNELEYYTQQVSSWPSEVKLAILSFYDGSREYLKSMYEEVFENNSGTGEQESNGMYDVIRNLSGTKYGTFKQVEAMLIHDVMNEIVASIEDNKRQEELINQIQ